jgi:hypothetical protein
VRLRAKCRRTTSAISTYTYRRCCQPARSTFLVCFEPPQIRWSLNITVDKGTAKIARKLGFDFAEAVVRRYSRIATVCVESFRRLRSNSESAKRRPSLRASS